MRTRQFIAPLLCVMMAAASSCSLKKPEAAEEREKWLYSLNDSIEEYKRQIEAASGELAAVQTEVGQMIPNFQYVSNPREVEGYYIYNGWKARYPLRQTGIVARITEDERFELIAVLKGGHFNQIAVGNGNGNAVSDVVPHDQALNYRAGNINTVCFSGGAADSVGMFIADNMPDNITLQFLNGGKTGSMTIPADEKQMIAATYQLYTAQKESHKLERKIPVLSKRIDSCRRMLESLDSVNVKK